MVVPAARLGDSYFCPVHGSGTILGCSPTVLVENRFGVHEGDVCLCKDGTPDRIKQGNPTVYFNGRPAVGAADITDHNGVVVSGAATVFLGNPATDAALKNIPPQCAWLALSPRTSNDPSADTIAANFNTNRSTHTKTLKNPSTSHEYPKPLGDDTAPAKTETSKEWEVEVRGRKIKVYEPVGNNTPAGKYRPTVDDVGKSLGALPDGELDHIKEVNISPITPSSPGRLAEFQGNGVCSIYPSKKSVRTPTGGLTGPQLQQGDLDWLMTHEGAHVYHTALRDKYGRETFDGAWRKAIDADKLPSDAQRSVTSYGQKHLDDYDNHQEDFADSVVLYQVTKNTPCEAAARAMHPVRYAILDRIIKK